MGEEDSEPRLPRLPRVNPDVRDVLSKLLLEESKSIFEKFENGDISIDEARHKMEKARYQKEVQETKIDIDSKLKELDSMASNINTLPIPKIIERQDKINEFIEKLKNVEKAVGTQKDIIYKMTSKE